MVLILSRRFAQPGFPTVNAMMEDTKFNMEYYTCQFNWKQQYILIISGSTNISLTRSELTLVYSQEI